MPRTYVGASALRILQLSDYRRPTFLPGPAGFIERVRDLIERGRLDVRQLKLGELVSWLLGRNRSAAPQTLGDLCGVLEGAARLSLLKARRLVGLWEAQPDEEPAAWLGPPAELPFRRSWLAEHIASGPSCFSGPMRSFEAAAPTLSRVDPADLGIALAAVLGRQKRPTPIVAHRVARVSLESRTSAILDGLAVQGELHFDDVSGETRDGCAAAFLACLILVRQGRVSLSQDQLFGEILVRPAADAALATA